MKQVILNEMGTGSTFSEGERISTDNTSILLAFSQESDRVEDLLLHQTNWLMEKLGYVVSVNRRSRIA